MWVLNEWTCGVPSDPCGFGFDIVGRVGLIQIHVDIPRDAYFTRVTRSFPMSIDWTTSSLEFPEWDPDFLSGDIRV